MIKVAAAIIYDKDNILICQRGEGANCAYLWEFPGGKLEKGETIEECLIRECREELGTDIEIKEIYAETTFEYPDKEIAFTFFKTAILSGEIKANVHNDIRWITLSELKDYEFCPADVEVVERLISL